MAGFFRPDVHQQHQAAIIRQMTRHPLLELIEAPRFNGEPVLTLRPRQQTNTALAPRQHTKIPRAGCSWVRFWT